MSNTAVILIQPNERVDRPIVIGFDDDDPISHKIFDHHIFRIGSDHTHYRTCLDHHRSSSEFIVKWKGSVKHYLVRTDGKLDIVGIPRWEREG